MIGVLLVETPILYECPALTERHLEARYLVTARHFGESAANAKRRFWAKFERIRVATGREPTGTFVLNELGISPTQWEEFNCAHVDPLEFLSRDAELVEAFERLSRHYDPVLFSNCPRRQAEKQLESVGILRFFLDFYTISESRLIKPHPDLLPAVVEQFRRPASKFLIAGPRWDVDVEPALAVGMRAELVKSRDELVHLARKIA